MTRAMVTGGGSGIGRAIAAALLERGFEVCLVGRDREKLAQAAGDAAARIVAADLATEAGIEAAARAAGARLDVLVHCAAGYLRARVESLSAREWDALYAANLRAPMLLTAACLPALRAAQGEIVFVNSSAGSATAGAGMAAYAGGKHALRAAADALRQEVNADGIRVLSIFPGRTDTPMQQRILREEGRTAGPGTLMRPEDVAAMVIAALSLPRSAEVTEIAMRPMRPLG